MGPDVTTREIEIGGRRIGDDHPPLVIAEIGINHEGSVEKATRMIDDAARQGCEVVKFQCHVIEDEMVPNDVVPGNASEGIWDIMSRCALTGEEDLYLKRYTEAAGMIYLSTPFSRAAAERLESMGVAGYKVGSGECNNFPLLKHIASFGKPVILSTGMNDLESIRVAASVFLNAGVPLALMHCTSVYPTPYGQVRLGAVTELRDAFPWCPVGLSDHSPSIYPCLGAVSLGASILERHFTSDRSWPGPDMEISMVPEELGMLIEGSRAIHASLGGRKEVLSEEASTIAFAYASVVTTQSVRAGELLTPENVWVKRPGTGDFPAAEFEQVLGRVAKVDISANMLLRREWIA